MHTITFNKIEHQAVERHATLVRDRMLAGNLDRALLTAMLVKLAASTTVVLARLEVFCLLRALRVQRNALRLDMEALEERRMRGGYDGTLDAAYHALDADAMVIDDIRRRLWGMI